MLDGPARATSALEDRILDATLSLIAKWGMGKTTLGDVARGAGCSRASVYRAFPGGKQELFVTLGRIELARYFGAISEQVDLADHLAEALTAAVVTASQALRDHVALQYVLAHEPDIVLPFLGFHQIDRLYEVAAAAVGPSLERFVGAHAAWTAEWLARVVLTYAFDPSPTLDLHHDADARLLVTRFLVPALQPRSPALVAPT